MNTHPTILVIGAGPGGSATAWGLASRGHDVLLIDWAEFPRDKTCGDGLTPMAIGSLKQMQALDRIVAAGAQRIEKVGIQGPQGRSWRGGLTEYMGRKREYYGLVLPRTVLDDELRQHAVEAGAQYQGQVRVEAIDLEDDRIVRVHARDADGSATIYEPEQVVIAVGANIGLLKRSGLLFGHEPMFIRAVRGYYESVTAVTDSFEFYFDADLVPGYGWIFPAGDGKANVGIGTMPGSIAELASTRSLLNAFLERRIEDGTMQSTDEAGTVKSYPLRIDFGLQKVAGKNWVVIGEAAGLVNPITGEGIDLAMESGLIASESMHRAIRQGRSNHRLYQRRVRRRFLIMFVGLRALRPLLVNNAMIDPILRVMNQHRFMATSVIKIAQGFASPLQVLHPLFVIRLFTNVRPGEFWAGLKESLRRPDHRAAPSQSS